jgi:hypothetical protein
MTSICRSAIDRARFPAVASLNVEFPLAIKVLFRQAYRAAVLPLISFPILGGLRAIRAVLGGSYGAFTRDGSLTWIEAVNSIPMFVVLFCLSRCKCVLSGDFSNLGGKSLSCALVVVLAVLNRGLSPSRIILPIGMIDEGRTVFRRAMRVR